MAALGALENRVDEVCELAVPEGAKVTNGPARPI